MWPAGALTFSAPLWLWALPLALALPLLMHLLRWRWRTPSPFPTVRFLQAAAARQRRVRRPRELALLLLRIGVLAALLSALAQPIWRFADSLPEPAFDQTSPHRHLLLVDRSASMARSRSGITLLDEAKRRAAAALAQLDPRQDEAALLWIDQQPSAAVPQFTNQFDLLDQMLRAAPGTDEAGQVARAFDLAELLLRERSASPITIHVFSDGQTTQWRELAHPLLTRPEVNWRFHHLAPSRLEPNFSLGAVTLLPRRPQPGLPLEVLVEVRVDQPGAHAIPLTLQLGDLPSQQQMLRFGEVNRQESARFTVAALPAAAADLTLTLPRADELTHDNQLTLHLPAPRPLRVLLITAGAARELALALCPDPQIPGSAQVRTAPPADAAALLPWCDVALLTQTQLTDPRLLADLHAHLQRGGGVLWWIDDQPTLTLLAQHADAAGAWLPLLPTEAALQLPKPAALQWVAFDPFLRPLGSAAGAALNQLHLARTWTGRAAEHATVLARAADGAPLLARRTIGSGAVIAIAGPVDPSTAGDWLRAPLGVALIHELTRQLAAALPLTSPVDAGSAPRLPLPGTLSAEQLRVLGPGESQWSVWVGQQSARTTQVVLPRLAQAGLYRVQRRDTDELLTSVAVRVPADESDLTTMPPPRQATLAVGKRAVAAVDARPHEPMAIWPLLLVLGVLLLIGESLLTAWRDRRERSQPEAEGAT